MKLIHLLPILFIVILLGCNSSQQKTADKTPVIKTFNDDGAWCWFSDPRAIYTSDGQIITGWIKKDGSVEVASLNPETGDAKFSNSFTNFCIGGEGSSIADNSGPDIQLYLDSENFKSGDKTGKNPTLLAYLSDENGINTVGTGIGHDITAVIDNDYSNCICIE